MFNRIMVAFDNSEHAKKAVKVSYEIAKAHNSRLHIITVVQLPDYAGTIDEVDEVVREGKNFYEAAIRLAVDEAEKQGIKTYYKILYGHIGESIIKYAKENNIDLIVSGSHGRSAVGRLLLGSVSNFLVKYAGCPVLIVRE